jgi:hypothetical protein
LTQEAFATIASMFHVRCILPEQGRIEATSFALQPTNSQGEAVCDLFRRYLSGRPAAFRDRLSFLKRGDIDLDWTSAEGGVALASIFCAGDPAVISVLLTGQNQASDEVMLEVFRENVLDLLFEGAFKEALDVQERPLLIQVLLPGDPEWQPVMQLLSAALASVYFRGILGPECSDTGDMPELE